MTIDYLTWYPNEHPLSTYRSLREAHPRHHSYIILWNLLEQQLHV